MQYKPTKERLDQMIQDVAGEVDHKMHRWSAFAEKFDSITDPDLTTMGYDATQISYIRSFVTGLKNLELRYLNQAPLNADDPSYFIRQMTRMIVF